MISPEEAVRSRLLQLAAVVAIISTRAYLLKLPQHATLPAARIQLISELDAVHLRGAGGQARSRVQVDAYTEDGGGGGDPYALARDLAAAIAGNGGGVGLSGWAGTINGITITGIARIDRDATYEAGEVRLVRIRQDFSVWWRPATNGARNG